MIERIVAREQYAVNVTYIPHLLLASILIEQSDVTTLIDRQAIRLTWPHLSSPMLSHGFTRIFSSHIYFIHFKYSFIDDPLAIALDDNV
jgi:hypothetical protein